MPVDVLPLELSAKWQRLCGIFAAAKSCVVAFSGGVDSSLLALAAQRALGERATAVYLTGESATKQERQIAQTIAAEIGIRLLVMQGDEFDNPDFVKNGVDRCYHCKKARFTQLLNWGRANDVELLAEGSNADDSCDYRPGQRAGVELGIRTPLAESGLSKNEIRQLLRHFGLSNWDLPSTPCLATRLAYDLPLTSERLKRVAEAEAFLSQQGITPVRVRLHADDLARIETTPEHIARFGNVTLRECVAAKLTELGFLFVSLDLSGFQSGSMNRGIVKEE